MLKCISFELKRAYGGKNFKIALSIGMFIVVVDFVTFYLQYHTGNSMSLIQAWIGTDFQFAYNSLFYILLSVIACLPYAGSLHTDIASGYDKNILVKVSRRKYLTAKGIAVFASAFAAVTIPLLLNLFVSAGFYQNRQPQRLLFDAAGIQDCNLFPVLFGERPELYCLVYILIDGLFAGLLGIMSLAFTRWCRSSFAAILSPFVFYIITGGILNGQDATSIAMQMFLNPLQNYITTFLQVVITFVVLFLFCGGIYIWNMRRRDVL